MPDARHYAQQPDWPVNERGLQRIKGDLLPGPSLDGTTDAPLQPWLGRLFDPPTRIRAAVQPVGAGPDGRQGRESRRVFAE